MPASSGFAKRLRAAIDAAGVNKKQLSENSGVSRPAIDAWLGGALPVQEQPIRQLADALGVDFAELWGSEARLRSDDRTRLLQLESTVKQVRALLDQLDEPTPGGEDDIPSALSVVEPQQLEEADASEPRRRRAPRKGA